MRVRIVRLIAVVASALVTLVAVVALSGCGTYDMQSDGASSHVSAEMGQLRAEAGTDTLRAAVINLGDEVVRVNAARVEWPGFAWSRESVDQEVPVDQAAAFPVSLGEANCALGADGLTAEPMMRVNVNGTWQVVPIQLDDAEVLRRLHSEACFDARLADTVAVRFRLSERFRRYDGQWVQNVWLLLERRGGDPESVGVDGLFGSVLLRLDPIRPGSLPTRPSYGSIQVPLRISVAGRCDPHTRSQSQQTFLLGVSVSLDGEASRRVRLPLTAADRARLNRLMDLQCG